MKFALLALNTPNNLTIHRAAGGLTNLDFVIINGRNGSPKTSNQSPPCKESDCEHGSAHFCAHRGQAECSETSCPDGCGQL